MTSRNVIEVITIALLAAYMLIVSGAHAQRGNLPVNDIPEAGPIVVVALVIITIVIAIVWGFIAIVWGFVSEIWNALKELNRHEVLPILALVAVVVGLFSFVVITH
jgi:vacuolar-type H+-ATPase subunit I/STV1